MPIAAIYGPDDFGNPAPGRPLTPARTRVSAAERAVDEPRVKDAQRSVGRLLQALVSLDAEILEITADELEACVVCGRRVHRDLAGTDAVDVGHWRQLRSGCGRHLCLQRSIELHLAQRNRKTSSTRTG